MQGPERSESISTKAKKRDRPARRASRAEVDDPTHDLDGVADAGEAGSDDLADIGLAPPERVDAMKPIPEDIPGAEPVTAATTASHESAVVSAAEGVATPGDDAAPKEADAEPAQAPVIAFAVERRKAVTLVVVGAIVVAFLGWLIGSQIESPGDVAARSAAPPASPILAEVEQRKLESSVIARGTAGFGQPRPMTLATSALKADAGVVTSLPSDLGAPVPEGGVLMTVSGRPVFAIQGAVPMFRDLGPGVIGDDVLQLEAALDRLGLGPGAVDGRYDAATEAAVRALYARSGYPPIVATADQLPAGQLEPGSRSGPGVQVPANEIFFVAGTPAHLSNVNVKVGEPAVPDPSTPGGLMTVSDSSVAISGSLRVKEAALVKPGMKVAIFQPDLGIRAKGKVTSVADSPGTLGEDQFHVHFDVAVAKPPAGINGQSVRLAIPTKATKGEQLVVPLSAVSQSAAGTSTVQVLRKGELVDVTVTPGLAADGFVVVTPIDKQTLKVGDQVVVGVNQLGG